MDAQWFPEPSDLVDLTDLVDARGRPLAPPALAHCASPDPATPNISLGWQPTTPTRPFDRDDCSPRAHPPSSDDPANDDDPTFLS